ncbi:MAG TPA: hypothetical protein VF634_11610 [Pyrinomonadaceae bacterium]|jgi:hypothetical protein
MSQNEIELKQGTHLFIGGNIQIMLLASVAAVLVSAISRDQVAEQLAGNNPTMYAELRESLKHEFADDREIDGQRKRVVVEVSYGVGGSRIETILATVEDVAAEREAAESAALRASIVRTLDTFKQDDLIVNERIEKARELERAPRAIQPAVQPVPNPSFAFQPVPGLPQAPAPSLIELANTLAAESDATTETTATDNPNDPPDTGAIN